MIDTDTAYSVQFSKESPNFSFTREPSSGLGVVLPHHLNVYAHKQHCKLTMNGFYSMDSDKEVSDTELPPLVSDNDSVSHTLSEIMHKEDKKGSITDLCIYHRQDRGPQGSVCEICCRETPLDLVKVGDFSILLFISHMHCTEKGVKRRCQFFSERS